MLEEYKQWLNEDEIKKAIKVLIPEGRYFEIRSPGKGEQKSLSGIFSSDKELFTAMKQYVDNNSWKFKNTGPWEGRNFYITLNRLSKDMNAMLQYNKLIERPTSTTADADIITREWLLIDLDPERRAEISSTDAEKEQALTLATTVSEYLSESMGFTEPLRGDSGNGYHLLYRINLENSPENTELIKNCLYALAEKFNNDAVHVDVSVSNAARISKLYGSLSQKGNSTDERPHRFARIISVPADLSAYTPKENLEKLAALSTKQTKTNASPKVDNQYHQQSNQYTGEGFNIEEFMRNHGITYSRTKRRGVATIYFLDHCPFNSEHRNGDAKIFVDDNNGPVSFKCEHNSCQGKKWQDVRELFEPGIYAEIQARQEEWKKSHPPINAAAVFEPLEPEEPSFIVDAPPPPPPMTPAEYEQKTQASSCIEAFQQRIKDMAAVKSISTGFPYLDKYLGGGLWPDTLITLAGGTGTGKTAMACCMAVNLAKQGQHVLYFSLETSRDEIIARGVSAETWLISGHDPERSQTTISIKTGRTRYPYLQTSVNIDATNQILEKAFNSYSEYAKNIYIPELEGVRSLGVANIAKKIKEHIDSTGKIPIVIVDYLQLCIYADKSNASDKQKTDDVILLLKNISSGKIPGLPQMCIIALSNVSRGNYEEEANLAMFKESGLIEFTSSVCLGLQVQGMDYQKGSKWTKDDEGNDVEVTYWENTLDHKRRIKELIETQREKGNSGLYMDMELKIMKNRNGQPGKSIKFFYSPMFNYYSELPEAQQELKPAASYGFSPVPNKPVSHENETGGTDEIIRPHEAIDYFIEHYYQDKELSGVELVAQNDNTKVLHVKGVPDDIFLNAKRGSGKGKPWQISITRKGSRVIRWDFDKFSTARSMNSLPIPVIVEPEEVDQPSIWEILGVTEPKDTEEIM